MLQYYVNVLNLLGFCSVALISLGVALLPSRLRAMRGNWRA